VSRYAFAVKRNAKRESEPKESLSLKSVVGANEMEAIYLNYLSPTFLLEYIQVKE